MPSSTTVRISLKGRSLSELLAKLNAYHQNHGDTYDMKIVRPGEGDLTADYVDGEQLVITWVEK